MEDGGEQYTKFRVKNESENSKANSDSEKDTKSSPKEKICVQPVIHSGLDVF